MRPATPISFVLLCLLGSVLPTASAPLNRGTPNAPPASSRPAPADSDDDDLAPPSVSRATPAPPQAGRGEKRRRSYASCNRDSHKRNLRGGARRRFLIRCKLGYERRQPPGQQGRRP